MKKYKPENPWDRWKVKDMEDLPKKISAYKAQNPMKITRRVRSESTNNVPPKIAHKGRLQSFNFSKA